MKTKQKCIVDGCLKEVRECNLCGMHAQRKRRYGDVNYVTPKEVWRERCRKSQKKKAKKTTYKKLYGRHMHRVIAEQKIGRALLRGEIVHHIDGNKHNNNPENLEVITQRDHIVKHIKEMNKARFIKHGY